MDDEECENTLNLIDFFEDENKLNSEEFVNCIPPCNTFLFANSFPVLHFIKNNLELTTKQKLNLLVDNYKNYYNLPEEFLHSIAREKLGLPFDYHDVKRRREQWLEKCRREKEEDLQEDRFQRQLEKQKKNESTFKIEKKVLTF